MASLTLFQRRHRSHQILRKAGLKKGLRVPLSDTQCHSSFWNSGLFHIVWRVWSAHFTLLLPQHRLCTATQSNACGAQDETEQARRAGAPHSTELLSICQVPFLLTPKAKVQVLQTEAALQKQHQMQHSSIQV